MVKTPKNADKLLNAKSLEPKNTLQIFNKK